MCDCVKLINEHLATKNAVLDEMTLMNFTTGKTRQSLKIMTEKLDRKVKRWSKCVVPTFCPFCGEKIARTDDAPPHHD